MCVRVCDDVCMSVCVYRCVSLRVAVSRCVIAVRVGVRCLCRCASVCVLVCLFVCLLRVLISQLHSERDDTPRFLDLLPKKAHPPQSLTEVADDCALSMARCLDAHRSKGATRLRVSEIGALWPTADADSPLPVQSESCAATVFSPFVTSAAAVTNASCNPDTWHAMRMAFTAQSGSILKCRYPHEGVVQWALIRRLVINDMNAALQRWYNETAAPSAVVPQGSEASPIAAMNSSTPDIVFHMRCQLYNNPPGYPGACAGVCVGV